MTKRLLTGVAAAALVLTFATGCGGDDGGGRPSVDEISEGIQSNDILGDSMDSKVADCVAEAFHDSDLSDDALQAIADGDEDYDPSDDDQEALTSVSTDSVAECAGVEMPETESPDTE
jgi:hypothetical protein